MIMKRMIGIAALSSVIAGSASAATATGRITYISPDRYELMLDNSDMYAISPAVNLSSVAVADRVTVNWDHQGREKVIKSLIKAPLPPAPVG
jgi:hypothetical protein